ncbi:hypothetical protein [Dokdonia pacifica]|uniref:Tissue inhibitor of metalloproteinase n=1 Tax=Dokdonia pacifica TaxID=1627892 RepID=A0A238W2Z3_9FLAO|nr:hypothetical protein [Dokdonia pacifica]SNR40868.1 hypothetical protein SAMN06265376_101639 [Dokdonia pacifica]
MKYIFSCLFLVFMCTLHAQQSVLTCADFKEGSFIIPMEEYIPFETLIIRQGKEQREIVDYNGETSEVVVGVEWTSDCTYDLTYKSSHNDPDFIKKDTTFKVSIVHVEILKIVDSCAYITASTTVNGEFVKVPGRMCKEELL